MIDYLASIILLIANTPFYILALATGYLFYDKPIFTRVLFILLLTGPFNAYLKSIWQVPLPAFLGDGWAFPSGHMQSCVVFWGWLALEFHKKWGYVLAVIISSCVSCSLVIKGYHTPIDVVGAVFFGLLSLYIYQFIIKKIKQDKQYFIGLIFSFLSIGLIFLNPKYPASLGVAPGSLLLFSIGWYFNQVYIKQSDLKTIGNILSKVLALAAGIAGIYIFQQRFLSNLPAFWQLFISTSILSLWVSFGVEALIKTFQTKKQPLIFTPS